MTGIRRRMAAAFLSIVGLLFLSGMISFFELNDLSQTADEMLAEGRRHVGLAHGMIEAVEAQNEAVLATDPDSLWYVEHYRPYYERARASVEEYMSATHDDPRAARMNRHAYRAVAPVLISLTVMIAAVLLLYYFTMFYCVRPITAMNRSLGQYISFKVPFTVKADLKDELAELKEKIDTLIASRKSSQSTHPGTNAPKA